MKKLTQVLFVSLLGALSIAQVNASESPFTAPTVNTDAVIAWGDKPKAEEKKEPEKKAEEKKPDGK